MDYDPRIDDLSDDFDAFDFDGLLETVAENRARRFVEYLQSEAGHTPTLRLGD